MVARVIFPKSFGKTNIPSLHGARVEACEIYAISFEKEPNWVSICKSSNPGVRKWYEDGEKCYIYWRDNGTDCSTCFSVCP